MPPPDEPSQRSASIAETTHPAEPAPPPDPFEDCSECGPLGEEVHESDPLHQRAVALLVPPIPENNHWRFACRCPACGARFESERDLEILPWRQTLTAVVTRVSLGVARQRGFLSDHERAAWKNAAHEALAHPIPAVRARAARDLESLARLERRWSDGAALLTHPDLAVRERAVSATADAHWRDFLGFNPPELGPPAGESLEALLAASTDREASIRALGVRARAFEHLRDRSGRSVVAVLAQCANEPPPAWDATLDALRSAPPTALAEVLPALLAALHGAFGPREAEIVVRAGAQGIPDTVAPTAIEAALALHATLAPDERVRLFRALATWPIAAPSLARLAQSALEAPTTREAARWVLDAQAKLGVFPDGAPNGDTAAR